MTDPELPRLMNELIADATVFYHKLRHYHWNVRGRHFFGLHERFEVLYTRWAGIIDALAERMRSIGEVPVHTMATMLTLATLEEDETLPEAEVMVRVLAADLEWLHAALADGIEQADALGNRSTAHLLSSVQEQVETDLWMLAAWLHEDTGGPPHGVEAATVEAVAVAAGAHTLSYMDPD